MDKSERDRLRALCDKATAGPWGIVGSVHVVTAVEEVDHNIRPRQRGQRVCGDMFPSIARNCSPNDSEFIAAARTAVPAMLDALEAAEAERDAAIATMEMATRTTEEIRRTTVEAIVRRLREMAVEYDGGYMGVGVSRAVELVEREFLIEKGVT